MAWPVLGQIHRPALGRVGFEHQVGLETADILVAHGEQYRNCHLRKLIVQIMQ